MAEALSERFGLPAEPINLLDHLDCKDEGPEPAFTGATIGPAVGAGLRMLGRDPLGIELLQDEFSPRNTFEVIRTTLATTITLLFLVIGIWTLALKQQVKAERVRYNDMAALVELMTFKAEFAFQQGIEKKTKDLAEKQAKRWVRSLPRDEKRIARMQSLLTKRHQFLQDRLGLRSDIKQLRSGVEVMTEIYKALGSVPRKQLGTWFPDHRHDHPGTTGHREVHGGRPEGLRHGPRRAEQEPVLHRERLRPDQGRRAGLDAVLARRKTEAELLVPLQGGLMSKDGFSSKGDHLKYYCIVFSILVIVILVVAIQQRNALDRYKRASIQAKGLLTAQGRTSRGRPRGIGDLAIEVEKFVKGYRESVGEDDESGEGISVKRMERAEMSVAMKNIYASPEQDDPNQSKGYRTRSREFTYGPCNLDQFTKLVWNIENWGRYRVYELRWKLADKNENSQPPYNRITKPVIRVGYRQPLTRRN